MSSRRTSILLTTAAMVLACAQAGLADEVNVKGLSYSPVRVTGVGEGEIVFRIKTNLVRKPISDVRSVKIDGLNALNQAEALLKDGKADQAVQMYDRAFREVRLEWQRKLIRYRRLPVLGELGRIDDAVEDWLFLLEAEKGAEPVLKMRPTKFARKGSVANRRAIQLLSTRREKTDDKDLSGAMGQLLLSLYEYEGMTKEAQALAEQLTGMPSSGNTGNGDGNTGTGTVTPPVGTSQLTRQLQAARTLLNSKPDIVAAQIQSNLSRYGPAERPVALYLLGRAQQKLAQSAGKTEQKQQLYRKAGLNLMRVVAYYPESGDAGMALYETGVICKQLGNPLAAQEAWRMVLEQFAATDAAGPARKALESTR